MAGRKYQESPEQRIVEGFFRGVVGFFRFIFGFKKGEKVDRAERERQLKLIRSGWEEVETYLHKGEGARSIGEADKLLDAGLRLVQVPGTTMGERLKAAQLKFRPDLYHRIWEAHKLRNRLAHEVGCRVDLGQARIAVQAFEDGLKQLAIL